MRLSSSVTIQSGSTTLRAVLARSKRSSHAGAPPALSGSTTDQRFTGDRGQGTQPIIVWVAKYVITSGHNNNFDHPAATLQVASLCPEGAVRRETIWKGSTGAQPHQRAATRSLVTRELDGRELREANSAGGRR